MAFLCLHAYGKWSKLKNGKKHRTCKKCNRRKTKNATSWDQFFCMHRWRKDRRRKVTILVCRKCAKEKEGKTR
jgi:hypothetical protein